MKSNNNKTHYVYKTTNIINGKFYVGVHYGLIDDNYLGSGILIKKAIKKYGITFFVKEILNTFDCGILAYEYETQLIQEQLLFLDKNCYNLSPNHNGPGNALGNVTYEFLYGEEKAKILKMNKSFLLKGKIRTPEQRKNISVAHKGIITWNKGLTKNIDNRLKIAAENLSNTKKSKPTPPWNKGLSGEEYSNHYKEKIKPPSMLGRIWINNGIKQMKIPKENAIPEGWFRGRCDNKGDNNPMRKKK